MQRQDHQDKCQGFLDLVLLLDISISHHVLLYIENPRRLTSTTISSQSSHYTVANPSRTRAVARADFLLSRGPDAMALNDRLDHGSRSLRRVHASPSLRQAAQYPSFNTAAGIPACSSLMRCPSDPTTVALSPSASHSAEQRSSVQSIYAVSEHDHDWKRPRKRDEGVDLPNPSHQSNPPRGPTSPLIIPLTQGGMNLRGTPLSFRNDQAHKREPHPPLTTLLSLL